MIQSNIPRCLLITHANLGVGLLTAVTQILGTQEEVITISNSDLALAQLLATIEAECSRTADTFIFTDFKGGSCDLAARTTAGSAGDRYCISGVNLAMLLSFFTKRSSLAGEELHQTVAEAGKRGIAL
jgi:mannose/fructose-specific phosphotransferase system component IIA